MRCFRYHMAAFAAAFVAIYIKGSTADNVQQEAKMVTQVTNLRVAEVRAPVTSDYFAILERSLTEDAEMAPMPTMPTRSPTTRRPVATLRPTTAKPSIKARPTRKPTAKPMKPTAMPSRNPTSAPTLSPSKEETQNALNAQIGMDPSQVPTEAPTEAPTETTYQLPKHGGKYWILTPSLAPTTKETQDAKNADVTTEPSKPPTIKDDTPKHGGIFWLVPTVKE